MGSLNIGHSYLYTTFATFGIQITVAHIGSRLFGSFLHSDRQFSRLFGSFLYSDRHFLRLFGTFCVCSALSASVRHFLRLFGSAVGITSQKGCSSALGFETVDELDKHDTVKINYG